jgi:hypothetical protein
MKNHEAVFHYLDLKNHYQYCGGISDEISDVSELNIFLNDGG